MKTPSDELFRLIKSLSGQEKRYFRLHSTLHIIGNQNKYLQLFDIIAKQDTYDEKELKKAFRGQPFVKQFTVIKNYLYEAILKSLEAYNSDNLLENKLRRQLNYISILYDKGLYSQCSKAIIKAEKLAEKYEHLLLLFEITEWKFKLAWSTANYKMKESETDDFFATQNKRLKNLNDYYLYRHLNLKLLDRAMSRGWVIRSREEIAKEFTPVISHEIFQNKSPVSTLKSKILHLHSWAVYHYVEGDFENSIKRSEELLAVLKENPHLSETCRADFISAESNLIYCLIRTGKFWEAPEHISKIKSLPSKTLTEKAATIAPAYLPELIIYNASGRLTEALKLIKEIETLLREHHSYISTPDFLYFYYNFACAYFKTGEFKTAARCLATILNNSEIAMLPEIRSNVGILSIMVRFELGDREGLPYLIRSLYRLLMKQNRMHQFEEILLNSIRKLSDSPLPREISFFRDLEKILLALGKQNPHEKYAMEYFGITDWLESRIKKMPVKEVVMKNKSW